MGHVIAQSIQFHNHRIEGALKKCTFDEKLNYLNIKADRKNCEKAFLYLIDKFLKISYMNIDSYIHFGLQEKPKLILSVLISNVQNFNDFDDFFKIISREKDCAISFELNYFKNFADQSRWALSCQEKISDFNLQIQFNQDGYLDEH